MNFHFGAKIELRSKSMNYFEGFFLFFDKMVTIGPLVHNKLIC